LRSLLDHRGNTENRRPSPNRQELNLRPVQPGQVLNPGGRPKIPAEVREAAMALTPKAIETLGKIMEDERSSRRAGDGVRAHP
jgi:hypothetical protein